MFTYLLICMYIYIYKYMCICKHMCIYITQLVLT